MTNRDLVRHLGRLLGPILLLMPFSMGKGYFVIGSILKKVIQSRFFYVGRGFSISEIRGMDRKLLCSANRITAIMFVGMNKQQQKQQQQKQQ